MVGRPAARNAIGPSFFALHADGKGIAIFGVVLPTGREGNKADSPSAPTLTETKGRPFIVGVPSAGVRPRPEEVGDTPIPRRFVLGGGGRGSPFGPRR